MRCLACNEILTDREAVRKDKHGTFVDLCNDCISASEEALTNNTETHHYSPHYSPHESFDESLNES